MGCNVAEFWMVRAGEGGYLIDEFDKTSHVAIGWREIKSFEEINSLEEMREAVKLACPAMSPGALANSAAMAWKFRGVMKPGDKVLSYDPVAREYLLGTITGDYKYSPGTISDYPHVRAVNWLRRVSRDLLPASSRNTLGSTLTIFQPGVEVLYDLEHAAQTPTNGPGAVVLEETEEEFEVIRRDTLGRAHEFIKDRILKLSPDDMEELTAALLRAMGFRARVKPKGPDRGRDVEASPDGLGLTEPRIKAEVKHRKGAMGAPEIRSFIGGLREGDRGMYLSTGGFTREARYEAERSSIPLTLVDLDGLAILVVEHYESFDLEGRSLVPLVRVYWPTAD